MRNLIRYTFFLVLFIACTVESTEAQTVYITETGSKYHKETYRYLSHSKYPLSLSKAKNDNYEACKVCKPTTTITGEKVVIDSTKIVQPPQQTKKAVATQCTATAKSTGNRCKRKTKNASGKCWQHE